MQQQHIQQQQVTEEEEEDEEEESSEMGLTEASLSPSPEHSTLSFATQASHSHSQQHRRNISSPMMALPMAPPMNRSGGMYDSDASPVEDFDDDGFFQDD